MNIAKSGTKRYQEALDLVNDESDQIEEEEEEVTSSLSSDLSAYSNIEERQENKEESLKIMSSALTEYI